MEIDISHLITAVSSVGGTLGLHRMVQAWTNRDKVKGELVLSHQKQVDDADLAQAQLTIRAMQEIMNTQAKRIDRVEEEHKDCTSRLIALSERFGEVKGEMNGRINELRDRLSHYDTSAKVALEEAKVANTKAEIAQDMGQKALTALVPPGPNLLVDDPNEHL